MKTFLLYTLAFLLTILSVHSQTVVFHEGFENVTPPALPVDWTQETVIGSEDWITFSGGHSGNPTDYAPQGEYNAMFQVQSSDGETTKLITPPIDLSDVIKPELRFKHAQDIWYAGEEDWDQLKIYYKRGVDSSWIKLEEYLLPVTSWEDKNILLPDSSLSSTYYIAFEGITGYGHGVLIDTVHIVETGIIPKYLESIAINQANTSFIPTGTKNNPVLRIDFNVEGNDGSLILDSLAVKSLNTSDNNLENNGVKIYATDNTIFATSNLIGTSNFVSGVADFDNLNYNLPRNLSSIWICYDIKVDVSHEMHNNIADALIEESSIKVNAYLYPFADKSPEGSRTIYESVFIDDFETDKDWRLTGDFERAIPQGLLGNNGNPDPDNAYSEQYVLGNDLTSDGNYPNNLTDTAYVAEPPAFNFKYYQDINLTFYRWLNVQQFLYDKARIITSTDDITWSEIWKNSVFVVTNDNSWTFQSFNLSSEFQRKENARLKFTLGSTDILDNYTGWNIDNVIVVGDYISKDVGVTNWIAPLDGCGHSDEDSVKITIQNYAGEILTDPLAISYSFDGGTTTKYDTITNPDIAVDGSINYTIKKPIDLTTPGWYNNVYATTHLSEDEDNTNNRIDLSIFITPTYELPYFENFETNYGYYLSGGTNSSWEYGTPSISNLIIDSAASGTKAWVTNLDGNYSNEDSSYLESPCFNFTGKDSIVFEFKCKGFSEDKTDGLALQYSLDQGTIWNIIPIDSTYYWNWYSETIISELETAGIDETDNKWLTFRQLLPPTLSNNSNAKFRFVFESNQSGNEEGFGIDDIKIYDAPYDVGATSLAYPYDRCEWNDTTHVKVYIENYGITNIISGTKIPLSLDFESDIVIDTCLLTEDLIVGDSLLFTFLSTVDMSYAGAYNIIINTKLESDTYFYNDTLSNDTLYTTVSVTGMPRYNPFPDLIGDNPIDTFLVAGIGYSNYNWTGGGLPDITPPQDTLYVNSEAWYKVTVTNGAGCTANDSVELISSEIDLVMETLFTELVDSCERNTLTELSVRIKNNGLSGFSALDLISFGYQINEDPIVRDTLILSDTLKPTNPGDTVRFTYSTQADFRTPGNYKLMVFTDYLQDLDHSDDTISIIFNTWGFPDVELAYDTIYSSQADTLLLDAGSGFDTYTWNSGSDSITETPFNYSYYYKITVEDVNACGSDKDSTYIETHDFGISAVNIPIDTCENDVLALANINVDLTNYSANTYLSTETVDIYYNYDNTGWFNLTPQLGTNLLANDTISLDLALIDISNPGEHSLKIYTSSGIDANHTNDTIEYSFNTWEFPDVQLAYDTIFTTQADTIVLVAQDGFATYDWSDGFTTNDSLIITDNFTQKYIVTVIDNHGCGSDSDSTQIITYNLGVFDLAAPFSACEHTNTETVTITVKNYGQDIFTSGTSIPVGYIFNINPVINENLVLSSDLNPGQTVNYSFSQKVDMTNEETYQFKLFTDLELDTKRSNDTLVDALKTFGYPVIELGNDIFTMEPETLILTTPTGYNNYVWNDGTNNNTLSITYPASKLYSVTVTDINGCATTDDISIYTYDIGISSINTPITTCEFSSSEVLNITVLNNSEDTLLTDDTINLSYSLNGGTAVNEVLTLLGDLLPGTTVDYSFTSTLDLTTLSTHNLEVSCAIANDVNTTNDTLSIDVDAVGYPSFTLVSDIYTTNPVGTILTGPSGYSSYLWQDGSTSNTFTINYPASAQYALTVADIYGCEGSDTVEVYTYNVAADSLESPMDQCELSSSETVTIGVINTSQDTLQIGEPLDVGFRLNSGSFISESFTLTGILYPDSIEFFTLATTADLSANQLHEFDLFAKLTNIDVLLIDTITRTVDYQKPEFDLGVPVVSGGSEYIIDPGSFASYLWFNNSTDPTFTVNINDQNPNYYYAVTVTNIDGCSSEDSIEVTFTTVPDLSVTSMTSPESECWVKADTYPVHIILTNSGVVNLNPGTNFTVGYKIDEGTEITENFNLSVAMNEGDTREHTFVNEISFASAKVYEFKPFVSLADDGDRSNDTLLTHIDISAPEVDFVGQSDTVYFPNEYEIQISGASNYKSFIWSTNETTEAITVTETGTYSVTITDQYDCQGEGSIYCEKYTGIDNLIQGDGYNISFYPNPVSEKLMIKFDNSKSTDIVIEIVSSNGSIPYRNKFGGIKNSIEQIDVNSYSKGIYYIKFNINNEQLTRKIIIQ